MSDTTLGEPNRQPGTIVVAEPSAGSPTPMTLAAHAAVAAATGKRVRESKIQQAIASDDLSSKLPNPVRLNPDPAILLNRRFFADAMQETGERKAVLVAGDDANTYEILPLETMRTEAGDLYDLVKPELDRTDPTRQLLLLSKRAIHLAEDRDGQKTRVAYHLLRMHLDRSHVVLKGIQLNIPTPVAESMEETSP